MESVDAEVEIDMEISDDEQESCKGRVVAEQVVDDEGIKHGYPGDPSITSKTQFSRKRKWSAPVEITPSVRVEYHHLSKASRKKLQELLRDWSLWQGYHSRHSSSERVAKRNTIQLCRSAQLGVLLVCPFGLISL